MLYLPLAPSFHSDHSGFSGHQKWLSSTLVCLVLKKEATSITTPTAKPTFMVYITQLLLCSLTYSVLHHNLFIPSKQTPVSRKAGNHIFFHREGPSSKFNSLYQPIRRLFESCGVWFIWGFFLFVCSVGCSKSLVNQVGLDLTGISLLSATQVLGFKAWATTSCTILCF